MAGWFGGLELSSRDTNMSEGMMFFSLIVMILSGLFHSFKYDDVIRGRIL